MKVTLAQPRHIDKAAELFCSAFKDSITFFTPINDKIKNAMKDIFHLLYWTFSKGFFVAVEDDEVCGYIIMADNVKKLWIQALTSGSIFKALFSLIIGRYGITFSTLYNIIKNKLFYLHFEISTKPSAQLLSIGVHPKYQGRGVGKQLLSKGIEYIESLGIRRIKLEARPDNISAVKLYEGFGFKTVGKARDLQGEWLVMVRES